MEHTGPATSEGTRSEVIMAGSDDDEDDRGRGDDDEVEPSWPPPSAEIESRYKVGSVHRDKEGDRDMFLVVKRDRDEFDHLQATRVFLRDIPDPGIRLWPGTASRRDTHPDQIFYTTRVTMNYQDELFEYIKRVLTEIRKEK